MAMERYFPQVPGVDLSKLRITDEGTYSVTRPPEARQVLDFMRKLIGTDLGSLTILDGTANVGGETIHYALSGFKHVHAIELNAENHEVLRHNLQVYGLLDGRSRATVTVHHGDTTKIAAEIPADVLVLDPPWGGPDYKRAPEGSLDLWMGSERVDAFVGRLAAAGHVRWIFLKVPFNFAFKRLKGLRGIQAGWRKRIRNYFVVGLKVKPSER